MMETTISTASTALAETQRAGPTNTLSTFPTLSFSIRPPATAPATPVAFPTLRPSSTPLVFTGPSGPLSERIVYYRFGTGGENLIPGGTYLADFDLAPVYSDGTYTSDTAADLRTALEIALQDGRGWWGETDLEVVDAAFANGHAEVALQGGYFASGDAQPCALSIQILMTVFANPSVQSATLSRNGRPSGVMCAFREGDPPVIQTEDDVYTRAEIETFMEENAHE